MPVAEQELVQLMIADFGDGVRVSSSWQTAVAETLQLHEARRRPSDRPYRALDFSCKSISRQVFDVRTLLDITKTMAETRLDLPLWPDVAKVTAAVANGATSISVDSTDTKRFYVDQRAVLVSLEDWDSAEAAAAYGANETRTRVRARVETVTIASVSATSIGISGSIQAAQGFPAGCRIYPLIRSETALSSGGSLISQRTLTAVLSSTEVFGDDTIPASHAVGTTPSWATSYQSLPVLDLRRATQLSNASRSVEASGAILAVGLGSVPVVYGDASLRSRDVIGYELDTFNREDWWKFLEFFDSRGGRQHPFWMCTPEHSWPVSTVGGGGSYVEGSTEFVADVDWETRFDSKNVAFFLNDGSVEFRRVTAATEPSSGTFRLTLDSTVSFSASDIIRVSDLKLCRFTSDGMTERWSNPTTVKVDFSVVELKTDGTGEDDPSPPPVDDPRTGEEPDPDWEPDDRCDNSSGVSVPMFGYPCESCDTNRGPIRVADLLMPDEIRLDFESASFAADSARVGSQVLDKLISAIGGRKTLDHVPGHSWDRTTSRHWHHLRIQGVPPSNNWIHNSPTVTRALWQATRTYTGDDDAQHTLDIRVVVEYDTAAAGSEDGAWGALIHGYVFSDEIASYTDGTTHSDGVQYWRDDPCVSGLISGAPGGAEAKNCHPQLALVFHVPTSFQAPCGGPRVQPGANYATCTRTDSGAPWSDNDKDNALHNSMYGTTIGGWDIAALSLGGATPTSELFEYVTIENGPTSAGGITALSTTKPGWKEDTGELLATTGSAIEITVCLPTQSAEDSCHPKPDDQPYDQPGPAIGGSHDCWHTGSTETPWAPMCVPTNANITLTLTSRCRCDQVTYDSGCTVTDSREYQCGTNSRTLVLVPDTCSFLLGGTSSNRSYRWSAYDPDPDRVSASSEDEFDGLTTGWTTRRGTWQETNVLAITAVAGSGNLRALHQRTAEASSNDVQDGIITFVVVDASVDSYGVAYRGTSSGASYTGYFAEANPASGTLKFYYFASGTATEIGSASGVTIEDGDKIRVTFSGTEHEILVVGGSSSDSLSIDDCTVTPTSGYCGFGTRATSAGQTFDNWVLIDESTGTLVHTYIDLDEDGWHLNAPEEAWPHYIESWCELDPAQDEQCQGCTGSGNTDICKTVEPIFGITADSEDCNLVGAEAGKDGCFTDCDLWTGYVAARARLTTTCTDDESGHNEAGALDGDNSQGFDVWWVACAF